MNWAKTAMLLAAMTALFMGLGYLIGGAGGLMLAFVFALGTNAFAFWRSDKVVLRMHQAEPVTAAGQPELYRMTEQLAANAGLPMPALYVLHSEQPNAFATGRNPDNAAVAVSAGLLRVLNKDEVAGVIAHELAHIKNRDTLIMTVAATVAGAISMLANFGLWFGGGRDRGALGFVGVILAAMLAPFAAMLVQMLISRTREYAADRAGAQISGNPLALASALQKIAGGGREVEMRSAEASPATAHMFIVNPLTGARMDSLFSTHPNPANRIAALEEMAASGGGYERGPVQASVRSGAAARRSSVPTVKRRR